MQTPKLKVGLQGNADTAESGAAAGGGANAAPEDPEAEVDVKFEPIVKLKPVAVPTGEEDEDVILEVSVASTSVRPPPHAHSVPAARLQIHSWPSLLSLGLIFSILVSCCDSW